VRFRLDRHSSSHSARALGTVDGLVMVMGLVLGVGIFRAPQVVASHSQDAFTFLGLWVVGGVISLLGALCYAELASAYPSHGGEYHFVGRALGPGIGCLIAWSRMTVLQTGSIALLAYVFGDYAAALFGLGRAAVPLLAAGAVIGLTVTNMIGHAGRTAQLALTALELGGLLFVIAAILRLDPPALPALTNPTMGGHIEVGLVFVLLTFGGWSEAAYLSAEMRSPRAIGRALVGGILVITTLYLCANFAYLAALGLPGVAASPMVAADLMRRAFGPTGASLVSAIVVAAALSSANAAMITGARSNVGLGRQLPWLSFLTRWRPGHATPVNALAVQGAISLALVAFGAATRQGFETMVAYTAPVFWLTLLLAGLSLFVLRRRDPDAARPFRVPLYPLTPLCFCAAAAYMVYATVAYAGIGALLGVGVMVLGLPLYLSARPTPPGQRAPLSSRPKMPHRRSPRGPRTVP
jgi:basic amino acid/polyamine antiporter, APA family